MINPVKIGDKFSKWSIIKPGITRHYRNGPNKYWVCRCICNIEKEVSESSLRAGQSSGCIVCACKKTNLNNRRFNDKEKYCPGCKIWKPLIEFHNSKDRSSGKATRCIVCQRHIHVNYAFNLNKINHLKLLEQQNYKCAIPACINKIDIYSPIDHNHACCSDNRSCGKCIRGILCGGCNKALGLLGDDPMKCKSAATYLEKSE